MSELTSTERIQIVAAARSMLGIKYFHAGRNEYGVDCIGLLICSAHIIGMDVLDNTSYSPIVNTDFLRTRLQETCIPIDRKDILPGDIVLLNAGRSPQHMAMITQVEPMYIIHAHQTIGRVIEHRADEKWQKRIVAFYRGVAFTRRTE